MQPPLQPEFGSSRDLRLPFGLKRHPSSRNQEWREYIVTKTISTLTNVVGLAALVMFGYVLIVSIPDVKRYVRISTM
jgi:hypothetical protein